MENNWLNIQSPEWPFTLKEKADQVELTVPATRGVLENLKAIAGESELNMLKLLMGGLAIVLWKYTGQKDIVIATPPLSLEDDDETENKTLYLVLNLHASLHVKELLGKVHASLNDAHINADYDERSLKAQLELHKMVGLICDGAHANGDWLQQHQLVFVFTGSELKIIARDSLLPHDMLCNIAESILYVASNFSTNKEKTIAEIDIVPPAKVETWRAQFKNRKREYPTGLTVIDLFEAQVKQNPSKTALVFAGESVSYEALDKWSANIANYILTKTLSSGLAAQSSQLFITVMIERSPALIAAVLGILRAGTAYVPLDPAYPAERIREIIADTQAPFILTNNNDSVVEGCEFINIADIPESSKLLPRTSPDGVAYVIYSSGTTGKPKGIMIQHKAILNLLYWYNERYEINENTRIVQLTNIVVDIAFQEIFSALINGLTLYIPQQQEQQDKQLFLAWLEKHAINFIQVIPDMLATYFLDTPKIKTLDLILCGGDKLNGRLKDKILEKGYRLFNIYGQTETAIDTVGAECRYNEPMHFDDYVPNYEVFILDEHGNLCAEYVAGEICTAGDGLALGYMNNAAITAQKFVAHPYDKGQRMYRTGDRARRMPDGSINLLGREDQQVKIRGYRIELEEVEGVLHRHPSIENAAVIVKEESNGDKQLVAFLVSNNNLDVQVCAAFIKQRLPQYMTPDQFVQVEKLPLTANGKVDRRELAKYEGKTLTATREFVAARNATEAALIEIWQEVLGRTGISVNDDFFDLGGHSLKVTRLVSRIRKALGVSVSLKEIFLRPVLQDQAALISKSSKENHVAIPALPIQDGYEVSSSQSRLWMLCQFEGSNAAYNIPGVVVFEGELNREALSASFAAVINRHEILRTVFRNNDAGAVRQYIVDASATGFEVGYNDLRDIYGQEEVLRKSVTSDFHKEFDLSTGPLLRASLYQVADHKWVLSYVMHHIVGDDWSMGVFFNDLLRSYKSFVDSGDDSLPALRIQYKDYAGWQRQQLTEVEEHKRYWLAQFSDELPVLELPLDKPRPAVKTYNGGLIKHNFAAGISQQLQTLLRAEDCTLFMGLLSAVNTLLYRYTGQEDIIVGSPVAGREHSDLEEQIGFYVNTIALRSRFNGEESFRSLLQTVKETTLGAYAHQVYPFDVLVNELSLQHNPARSALFDVMVALQNAGDEGLKTGLPAGLNVKPFGTVEHVSSKFDLLFNFQEANGVLQVAIEYNSDLFERSAIERMGSHLENLISAIVSEPEQSLYGLSYLSTREIVQLTEEFNAMGDVSYPSHETVVSLFESQVQQTPDNIALVFEDKRITYRSLNELSNQLAHYLREHRQVQRQELVGLLLERNEWMVIAILAVLKAGGVYVPIDPQYPKDRQDFMQQDSGCRVLIDASGLELFQSQEHVFSIENPSRVSDSTDLAYVIYTSGTTGKPKGSLISHYQVVRLFRNDKPLFNFTGRDVWTLFHSYCFDFSVWEMYGALLFGGSVVVVPQMVAKDPTAYLELLHREKVTVLNQTPSSFYNLIKANEEQPEIQLNLRYVIFGGEALSPGRLKAWYERYPDTRLINMYGITETTVHVTYKEIADAEINNNISNIGRAIPTLRTYVLDAHQQLLPVGVWGEMYVGGAGVARGYLNREELTKQRFLNSWFRQGERLYRSGDRVRILQNGEMEYDGRLDEQVKIRGHRIELGEIELSLERHERVSRSVVIAKANQQGSKELVAYIVCEPSLNIKELRTWLSGQLPDYMMPAHFVQLNKMPLTSNGKIDRKKLPAPVAQADDNYAPAENEMQQLLVDVWQQVLSISPISIYDNFFTIGGNSISMIEIVAGARRRQVTVTIRQIFEHPTIATLSRVAVKAGANVADQSAVAGTMQLLPVQRWYLENQRHEAHHFNYSTIVMTPASFSSSKLFDMVAALVKKHDVLRMRFPLHYNGTASYEAFSAKMIEDITAVIDHSNTAIEERAALVSRHAAEMQKSLSLHAGPLVKVVWYNYGNDKGRLLIVIHHLVVDGVSWRLLLKEIDELLLQAESKQPLQLAGKTTSYKSFSEKLVQYSRDQQLLRERRYWYNVIESAKTVFPVHAKVSDRSVANQQQLVVEWSEDYTARLYHSLKAYNAQVKDLLLTALMNAVCKWANTNSLLIHQEGHGRENIFEGIDLSQTIGWFTSIYPVLLNSEHSGIATAIKYVKENLRSIPNNGIGYGVLRYIAQDEKLRQLEQQHTAAVLFNYLGEFNHGNAGTEKIAERTGLTTSPMQQALYPLELNGGVLNKQLKFSIAHMQGEFEQSAMQQLADMFKSELEDIIDHCVQQDRTRFTTSDFPLAALSQERIEELEEQFPYLQELYPATSMQKAMFFHSLVADEGAYVVQQHGNLKNVNPELFAKAWKHLIQRHSILRTAFVLCETNGLLQVVNSSAEVPYTYVDCRSLNQRAWERKIASYVEQDATISFDFENAPLFRYTLLQRDEHSFYVLLSVHHIILDGWSMPVLFSELSAIYRMLSNNEPVKLPQAPDYGKYVQWLLTQNQVTATEFWRNKFSAGEVSHLSLLEDAAPALPVTGYRELATELSFEESEALRNTAAKLQVTLHTLLVASWARVLSSHTATGDVLFGMTISGRSDQFEEISNMVGLFINSIPVKVEGAAGQPLATWLSAIHNQQLEYNQYGLLGLNDIRRLNNIDSNSPLFESLLVHQNYPNQLKEKQGDNDASFEFSNAGFRDENNVPLTVMVFSKKQLAFSLIYKTEVFRHDFMERVAADFKRCLIAIAKGELIEQTQYTT